jgi:glucoamylase
VTDPARSAVLVDIRFESLTGRAYDVYVLHDAALGLNANDDTGHSVGDALAATDDELSSAVVASPGFTKTSSGYLDRSDGWSDLRDDRAMDWSYTAPRRGNVAQTGATTLTGLPGAQGLRLALGFGEEDGAALDAARASLDRGFASARRALLGRLGTVLLLAPRWSSARWAARVSPAAISPVAISYRSRDQTAMYTGRC